MHFSLKRIANTLGLFSQGDTPVPVQFGWNGLPEDIFILIIKDYLGVDSAAANSLAQTCRAYSSFSRPHLLRTVYITEGTVSYDLTDSKKPRTRIEQFQRDLKRNPQLCNAIGTLRIVKNSYKYGDFQKPGPRGPSLMKTGESLVYILSRHFPNLRLFELPRLTANQHWTALSSKLQDAVYDFLRRHAHGSLQELSVSTRFPLEFIRHCPTITKLEYRIIGYDQGTESVDLLRMHGSQNPGPVSLKELAILDTSSWGSGATSIAKRFTEPGNEPCVSLKELESLAYYGNNGDWSNLRVLLASCAATLSSLKIIVSDRINGPKLDLSALRRLKHLTLSLNRMSSGAGTLSWISSTIKDLYGPPNTTSARLPPLQTLEIVVKALGRTAKENVRDMGQGWIASTIGSLRKAGSVSTEGPSRRPWNLKEFRVVVCVERFVAYTGPTIEEQGVLVSNLRELVVDSLSRFSPPVAVDVKLVRDEFYRWLRYPSIPRAPFHY